MNEIISEGHRKALGMMSKARKILLHELHYFPNRTLELVNGLDKLGLAFEFVEHPLEKVNLCPQCEGFCLEIFEDGSYMCLSCDHQWC